MSAPRRIPLVDGRQPPLIDQRLQLGQADALKVDGRAGFGHATDIGLLRSAAQGRSGPMARAPSRTAIVTGAGKRVGAEIAHALLADGWSVVAHVHDAADAVPEGAAKAVADLAAPECAATRR